MSRTPLTPQDWLVAALAALAEGGIEAVRVEPLSRQLKTSKGSFYWHFADRKALLVKLVDLWESTGTDQVIALVEAEASAADRLRRLLQFAVERTEHGVDVAKAEAALRAWAAEDATLAARIADTDRRRSCYVGQLIAQLGYDEVQAQRLGAGLYLGLQGLYGARRYAPELADDAALFALADQIIDHAPATSAARPGPRSEEQQR